VGRPVVVTFLLLAAGGVVALAVLFLGDVAEERRGDREAAVPEQPEVPVAEPVTPGEEKPGTPRLAPGGRRYEVTGHVRDPEGRPIAGAFVCDARSDAEGRYVLRTREPSFAFDVWAAGYLPLVGTVNGRSNGSLDFVCAGDGPWTRDFVLEPAASVIGRVTDGSGVPVSGATVYLVSPEHQILDRRTVGNVTSTGTDGMFVFPGHEAGTFDLGVRARGFLPRVVTGVAIPERGTVSRDVVLERGRDVSVRIEPDTDALVLASDSRLRGTLLPPGGLPALAGALVGRSLAEYPVVQAGREGTRFVLAGVGPGPADVEARPYDESLVVEEGRGRLLDTTSPELTLRLVPAVRIDVHVRDAVTGARLEPAVVRRTRGAKRPFPVERAVERIWVPLDERTHTLHFTLDGYEPARLELPDLRTGTARGEVYPQPFDVAMQPVADGETGAFFVEFEPPLEGGRVALVGRDAEGRAVWQKQLDRKDEKGRWLVERVPVGEYAVSVLATGMVPVTLPRVVVTRSFKDTHRVRLEKGGGLEFKVEDADGELLDEVHVLLEDASEKQIDVHVFTQISGGRAFVSINYLPSAATARADSGLAPGTYTFAAYKEGYELATAAFSIASTETAKVTLTLTKK